jgi:hypothetical protein
MTWFFQGLGFAAVMLYGKSWELNLLKHETNLRQFMLNYINLRPILTSYFSKMFKMTKYMSSKSRDVIFSENKTRGALHNIAKGL